MKTIKVVAAVIKSINQNNEPFIFATQRGYGEFKGGWEFPGGKIEAGETPQEALKREIKEELDTEISVKDLICTVEYDYPKFHLSMDCFWCEIINGNLILKEHEDAKWLTKDNLDSVEWLPADILIIKKIKSIKITPLHYCSGVFFFRFSMSAGPFPDALRVLDAGAWPVLRLYPAAGPVVRTCFQRHSREYRFLLLRLEDKYIPDYRYRRE